MNKKDKIVLFQVQDYLMDFIFDAEKGRIDVGEMLGLLKSCAIIWERKYNKFGRID